MKKLKSFLQTKTKTSLLVKISLVSLLIFIGRFAYVPFVNTWDVEYPDKLFGFKWLSTFLSRIGNEFSWLAVGVLLIYASSFMHKEAKKAFINVGNLIIGTALYFLCWAIYDQNNFEFITEVSFAALTSFFAFIITKKVYKSCLLYTSPSPRDS